jgi:hypothetical protein
MKKLYTLALLLFVGVVSFAQTIYSENFGTPTATTTIANYLIGAAPATFQNGTPIVYSGTGDIRVTTASNTYLGASGGGNAYLTGTAGKYIQIDGINTSAYTTANLQMTFGYLTATFATVQVILEYSTNASATTPTWTPITFTNNTTNGWALVSIPGGILPVSNSLSLRFTQPTPAGQIRIDDIKVLNYNPACTLVLGSGAGVCDAVTFGIDTYTATIPYTGGGTGNYVMTPSSGTVGGDNPNTVAAGNITVTGITEGVNLTLDVVNGVCTYNTIVTAPECKPVNTLPYYEGFNYTAGANLGAQQRWTNVNSGDEVVIAAGSLSYPNTATSTGNSASFLGAGKDPFTPFTPISSGTIFASLLIKVADLTTTTATTGTYFLGLTDSGKGYQARLFAKPSGTNYVLGFDSTATTTNYDATLYNVNDTVLVVMSFDFNTLTYSVWFNPDITLPNAPTPTLTKVITLPVPPAAALNFGGFQIRQDADNTTPSLVIDELRIAPDFNSLGLNLAVAQNEINGLKVYPNPVKNGNLFITSDSNNAKTVVIYDVIGKQVVNTTITNQPVNVASLKAGIYVVKIMEDGKTATRKLVIE